MGMVQSALFLFSFRFVFGGAVTTGASSYVYYLVPGYVATIVLFTGGGIAVAVAEDRAQGFTDRLLSLPMPRRALVIGRAVADSSTNAWSICATAAFGFLFGFRLEGSVDRPWPPWACAWSTAWCSRSSSSSWASWRPTGRRRRACP